MIAFSQSMFEGQMARYYDLMHKHRNYRRESEFLHKIVQRMCPGANRILDVCCGTGEHAIRMAQAGYTVTGIDASQEMLGIARKKISAKRLRIDFRCSELSNLDFSEEFEVAYCLGYTFLYMTTYSSVAGFFEKIRQVLLPSGVLILDFLNGWSLVEEYSKHKDVYRGKKVTIRRFQQSHLDRTRRVRHVEFFYVIEDDSGKVTTFSVEEDLRIFFEDEVTMLMGSHGFCELRAFGGYSVDSPVTDSSGVVVIAGRKR